jgi:hypothetical protein
MVFRNSWKRECPQITYNWYFLKMTFFSYFCYKNDISKVIEDIFYLKLKFCVQVVSINCVKYKLFWNNYYIGFALKNMTNLKSNMTFLDKIILFGGKGVSINDVNKN